MAINKSLRFEVLTRDGYRCRYCGATAKTSTLHIDHVLPKSKGGRDDLANLVTACVDCNFGKTDRIIVGIPDGFAITPDPRPARVARMRSMRTSGECVLDCDMIDEFDELDDCRQRVLVWCKTHKKLEWHYVPFDLVSFGGDYRPGHKAVAK